MPTNSLQKKIQSYLEEGALEPRHAQLMQLFCRSYTDALGNQYSPLLKQRLEQLIDFVKEFSQSPYPFAHYHRMVEEPFNYHTFGLDIVRPLIDFAHSQLHGLSSLQRIVEQLDRGENCILLSNHQTEADPHILELLLEPHTPILAKETIYVAGSRVTSDPFSIPFSLGRDLLCIYSKKYIDNPPHLRALKQSHNRQTMDEMRLLLNEGGKCIYVAPSGGRDRRNKEGKIEIAPFDPSSIEFFRLVAEHAQKKTHFYPLALNTYDILPPPEEAHTGLGEERLAQIAPVGVAIGEEILFASLPDLPKMEVRALRAQMAYEAVVEAYKEISEDEGTKGQGTQGT